MDPVGLLTSRILGTGGLVSRSLRKDQTKK
jgi:hypothetical protein